MKVSELIKLIDGKIYCGSDGLQNDVNGCYIGDLLSLAMSKVQKDNVWITIQSNINIAAVATLTEASCIVICEGFEPDENTKKKADAEDIPIIVSDKSAYELAIILSENGI